MNSLSRHVGRRSAFRRLTIAQAYRKTEIPLVLSSDWSSRIWSPADGRRMRGFVRLPELAKLNGEFRRTTGSFLELSCICVRSTPPVDAPGSWPRCCRRSAPRRSRGWGGGASRYELRTRLETIGQSRHMIYAGSQTRRKSKCVRLMGKRQPFSSRCVESRL